MILFKNMYRHRQLQTFTIYIALQEIKDKIQVKTLLKTLLQIIHVADVSENNILVALNSDWTDFEDSVQNAVAESHDYDAVVTRNKNDYKKSNLKVFSPTEFLEKIEKDKNTDKDSE